MFKETNHTFEYYQALLNGLTIPQVAKVATSTNNRKQSTRDFKFIGSQHREEYNISNHVANIQGISY